MNKLKTDWEDSPTALCHSLLQNENFGKLVSSVRQMIIITTLF